MLLELNYFQKFWRVCPLKYLYQLIVHLCSSHNFIKLIHIIERNKTTKKNSMKVPSITVNFFIDPSIPSTLNMKFYEKHVIVKGLVFTTFHWTEKEKTAGQDKVTWQRSKGLLERMESLDWKAKVFCTGWSHLTEKQRSFSQGEVTWLKSIELLDRMKSFDWKA